MRIIKPADREHWQAIYNDHTGKRVRKSTGCTDKKAAMTRLKELMREVEVEKASAAQIAEKRAQGIEEITLGAALRLYVGSLDAQGKSWGYDAGNLMRKTLGQLQARKPHPKSSPEKARRQIAAAEASLQQKWHLDPEMPLVSLTPRHLEQLVQERRREGMSAASIAHELKVLRSASRFAKGLNYETPSIDNWRLPKTATKTRYLSPQEFAAVVKELTPGPEVSGLVAKSRQEARDLLVVLVMTGGRWSEIAELTWARINWEDETIAIWGNKTQRERAVPIMPPAMEVLKRRFEERNAGEQEGEDGAVYTKRRHNPYVFPSRDLESHRKSQCRPITEAIDRAGLNGAESVKANGRATVHSLRHTYASWLLANGADLSDVQDALGHTTLQMTRRYAHLSRAQSIKRLSTAMGRAVEAMQPAA